MTMMPSADDDVPEGGGDDVTLRFLVIALRQTAVVLAELVHELALVALHRRERVTARLVRALQENNNHA